MSLFDAQVVGTFLPTVLYTMNLDMLNLLDTYRWNIRISCKS